MMQAIIHQRIIFMPAPLGHPAYNLNGEGGRPVKFTAEVIDQYADELLEWMKDESKFWLKDFCLEKGLNPDLMSLWAKQSQRFSGAYETAYRLQEARIYKGALVGNYNPSMAKLGLTNWHGWTDKTEQKVHIDGAIKSILLEIEGKTEDLVRFNE